MLDIFVVIFLDLLDALEIRFELSLLSDFPLDFLIRLDAIHRTLLIVLQLRLQFLLLGISPISRLLDERSELFQ